ncbi:hypothetical protein P7E02_05135 [Enterococcus hulanensis]|uniref:hypothetical protein n=1 Tax=Enterococcus hulanensis TaxID=2559929 RepID=UPI00288E95C8|nr:hypothetical protein [Enterococcus hulanensis]MDT2659240.1 hypothetical protein [Enterococcus hulanensis]
MNIYDYQNKSLNPLFNDASYLQLTKRDKNKEEYIRSLNLLLLSVKRIGEIYSKEMKVILPNLFNIVNTVECDLENGYHKWINRKLNSRVQFDCEGINIEHKNNQLNELENLLLILIFQNFQPSDDRYNKQVERLLTLPEKNAELLVYDIRTKTKTEKSKYNSLIKKYGIKYINCYMGLQVLFLSSYNQHFKKLLVEMFKEKHDKQLTLYTQQERKKGIRLSDKEVYQQFMKDKVVNGSSYYQFEIYSDFIEAIRNKNTSEWKPFNPYIAFHTLEVFNETYTVLYNRDTKWWLLDSMNAKGFDPEHEMFQNRIDNYPLFSLLDIIIAEIFFPGIDKLYEEFATVQHEFRQSVHAINHYLSSGYGRLSYLLTCADNGKYEEEYWF